MPCYQTSNLPAGFVTTGRTVHRTAAECNQACGEGACCEGTSCSVKPACRCQRAGQVFRGVGTVCTPNPCLCCCQFFDLHDGGVQVTPNADSSCIASNNRAISPCVSYPVVVSVSGVTGVVVPGEPGFLDSGTALLRDLSFANTSRTALEICGQSGIFVDGPSQISSGFSVQSSSLTVVSWFSPYDSLHDDPSDRCSNGSVRFRVELSLDRIYQTGGVRVPLRYQGFHKGACTSLDSYSALSSMLAGQSVTMTCNGTFTIPGLLGATYAAVPQIITVSFSANPLP
jgi:hypothetical protein